MQYNGYAPEDQKKHHKMVCADLQKTSRSLQASVAESDLAGHTGHQALLDIVMQRGTIPKAKFIQTNCISSSCPAPSCNSQGDFSICLLLLVGKAMGPWPKLGPQMHPRRPPGLQMLGTVMVMGTFCMYCALLY